MIYHLAVPETEGGGVRKEDKNEVRDEVPAEVPTERTLVQR